MPGKNLIKDYVPESYYHIYNRGVNKQPIFIDDRDRVVFLSLLKRYLGEVTEKNRQGKNHPNYSENIELLAFCLMGNHFHLFVYQLADENAITEFMRSLMTAYSMYFNKKYKRVGPVFQQRFRAVRIVDDAQLLHITRYIHLNPAEYKNYEWSSYQYYINNKSTENNWLKPDRALELFDGDYAAFVADYEDYKYELDILKTMLADA